jgi:hypothetical protein
LKEILESETAWKTLLFQSHDSPSAVFLLEGALERLDKLGGLKYLESLQESGTGRKLVDLATSKAQQVIQKR